MLTVQPKPIVLLHVCQCVWSPMKRKRRRCDNTIVVIFTRTANSKNSSCKDEQQQT